MGVPSAHGVTSSSLWGWTLLGVVVLSGRVVVHASEHPQEEVEQGGSRGEVGVSPGERGGPSREGGCAFCDREAFGTVHCRCKQYEYATMDGVNSFYNVDHCTGVTQVPNFTLACTEDILELSLSDNALEEISKGAFNGLSFVPNNRYLSELRLSNVSLHGLDPAAFEGIQGVVHVLDLSHNHLGTLPDAVFGLPAGLQKLLLNNNGLTIESLQGLLTRRKAGEDRRRALPHLESLKIIDLSHNNLKNVPDLLLGPGGNTGSRSQLEEIRLHGNPIIKDLSAFVALLSKHRRLQKVTWPQPTVSCSCATMAALAQSVYSDFNFPVIYPRDESGEFTDWAAVTCDERSVPVFVDRPIGLLSDEEVRRECWQWATTRLISNVEIAAVATEASGSYTIIKQKPGTSGGQPTAHRSSIAFVLLVGSSSLHMMIIRLVVSKW